jgi:hypothetical protein
VESGHVASSESAASMTTTTAPKTGGRGVGRHRRTERHGGEQDHCLARDGFLFELLNEVNEVHDVCLSGIKLNVNVPKLFTEAPIKSYLCCGRLCDRPSFPDQSNDGRRTIERAQAMRRYRDNESKFGFIDH